MPTNLAEAKLSRLASVVSPEPVLDNAVKKDMQDLFLNNTRETRRLQNLTNETVCEWTVVRLARELNIPLEDVRLAKSFFDKIDCNHDGALDIEEFEQVALKYVRHQLGDVSKECVTALCSEHWDKGDRDHDGFMSFCEFLLWYSANRFLDDFVVTPEARYCRHLAQKYKVSSKYVERFKQTFDHLDRDASGNIEIEEFKEILHKLWRIAPDMELPSSRVQYFWSEVDRDGNGTISFEEFLHWWVGRGGNLTAYDEFYKKIMSCVELDPPAYPAAKATGRAVRNEPLVQRRLPSVSGNLC